MPRTRLAFVALIPVLLVGCGIDLLKGKDEKPDDGKPIINRDFRSPSIAPVGGAAHRASTGVDFSQLAIYFRSDPPPQSLADLKEMQRDFRRGYQAIEKGEVVVIWKNVKAMQGIYAYETQALTATVPQPVLTSGGVQNMTAAELKAQLGK
jgi:uncharacterized protein related to proFAR isomerase